MIDILNYNYIENLSLNDSNERKLILSSKVIAGCDDYVKDSDDLLQWINDNYDLTSNKKDYVKLKDIYNMFKDAEYFTDMKKAYKNMLTFNQNY